MIYIKPKNVEAHCLYKSNNEPLLVILLHLDLDLPMYIHANCDDILHFPP